jgi:hypothetical protein
MHVFLLCLTNKRTKCLLTLISYNSQHVSIRKYHQGAVRLLKFQHVHVAVGGPCNCIITLAQLCAFVSLNCNN